MPFRVGIFALDAAGQRHKHGFGALQFVRVTLQGKQRPNARQELNTIDRLGEKIVRAGLNPRNPILDGRKPCNEHHRSQAALGTALHQPADLQPVQLGHHHVEENQIGVVG